MAIQDINAQGGINGKVLSVVYEDNPNNEPRTAVDAFYKLRSEGIDIIFGPNFVTSAQAVAPLACDQEVLLLSPTAGNKEFHARCDRIFDFWSNDDLLSIVLAENLKKQGIETIAIIGSQDSWERGQAEIVRETFTSVGGDVVSYHIVTIDEKDFRPEALAVKESGAQAVVFTNFVSAHLSAKRLRESGVNVPFYSVVLDDSIVEAADGAFEGAKVITSFTPTKEFSERYEQTYQTSMDAGADSSYDMVMLLAEAMRKTDSTDPAVLAEYLGAIRHRNGVSGSMTFTEKGGVIREPFYMVVENNHLVRV